MLGLYSFIQEQTRVFDKVITKDTLIEEDLGVTGEEAVELLTKFSRNYNVNISQFEFGKYFNDEPSVFLQPKIVKPFKVEYLEKAILAGRLDDDIINS